MGRAVRSPRPRSHRPPLTRTSVVVQRYFLITTKLLISNPIPAKEITKTPAGTVARVRPHRTIVRGGSRVTRGKRSVFPKRVYAPSKSSFHVISHFIDVVPKNLGAAKFIH